MLSRSCARLIHLLSYSLTQKTDFVSLRTLSLSASLWRQRGRGLTRHLASRHRQIEEDAEHFDALEDFINQSGAQGHGRDLERRTGALIDRHIKRQQRNVKEKILERKFFKEPQEINLLTWNAKQQIRYLHEEFPDEWTPEQLAESFPVSVEGVHRLLKSSYIPRSEQEIAKHDRRVMAHWQQLKETLALDSGPVEDSQTNMFQHIIDAGKLPLMINAGGSPQLPAPKPSKKRLLHGEKRMGLFESIVAGSQVVKAKEEGEQKQIEERKSSEVELLKEIAEFQKRKRKEIPAHFPDQSRHQR